MRTMIEVILILAILCIGSIAHQKGYGEGYRQCRHYYEGAVAQSVDRRVAGLRRVQALREKSAYERGRDTCKN